MSLILDSKSNHFHVEQTSTMDASNEKAEVEQALVDARFERKLKLKIDLLVLPFTAIAYFLASMDRSDLGNAKIAGLTKDLNISDQQYSNIVGFFYVGYLVFQLPSTLGLRYLTPPVQIFLAMLLWGTFTTCLVAAKSYATVAGLRFLIGVAEAGLQGLLLFLAIIYKPGELTKRIAFTFSTSALAGACNGLIAYGVVEDLAGQHGWSWQWIFIVEGAIPMGFAFIVLVLYPSTPERTGRLFFNTEEKALLVQRSREAANTGEFKFSPKQLLKLIMDPIFWLLVVVYGGPAFALAGLSNFLPAVIEGFGWSPARSQAMSVIPYAISFVTTNLWAHFADRYNQRGVLIVFNSLLGVVGFIVVLTVTGGAALLVGCCITLAGVYPAIALSLGWIPVLLPGHMFRAGGVALINACAQAASISASQAYRHPAHDYREGHIIALSVVAAGACAAAVLRVLVTRWNRAKAERRDLPETARLRLQSIDELGHEHPDFYFPY